MYMVGRPLLHTSFHTHTLTQYLRELDLSLLPEVHALSSGLKALTAEVVSAGIEKCRKLCGGHGCVKGFCSAASLGAVSSRGHGWMLADCVVKSAC